MSHKIAIVVGHNTLSQGAVRPDTNESEFVYNSRLAKYIEKYSDDYDLEVKIFYRTSGLGYSKEINRVYDEVDEWNPKVSVELHFNAAGFKATGTETFSSGSRRSLILAKELQEEMVATLGLRDRGIKIRNARTKGRGYLSLISGKSPAALIEPFFATSDADRKSSDEDFEQIALAKAILKGCRESINSF